MSESPISNAEPLPPKPVASGVVGAFRRVVQWIPPKARLAVCFGSLVLIPLAIYTYLSNSYEDLNLIFRHNLESAELTVAVDGKRAFSDQVSGTVKKRFGFLDKRVEGTLSKTLRVPPGKHVVRVSLKSSPERFDQTKQVAVNLVAGREATVSITTQKGQLSLAYQGAPVAPDDDTDAASTHSGSFWSILITAMGSVGSAAIGFMVQEFLRARKAAFLQSQASKLVQ